MKAFIVVLLFILAIIIIAKISKAQKVKKEKAAFKNFLIEGIDDIKNDKLAFEIAYKAALEKEELTLDELELVCKQIPHCKEEFSKACKELAAIGKSNVCLMSDDKAGANLSDEKIACDVKEALPVLARFYKEYDRLYKMIYKEILTHKIVCGANMWYLIWEMPESAWTEPDGRRKEVNSKLEAIDGMYGLEINDLICKYLNLDKGVEVRESTDARVVKYVAYADELRKTEELFERYVEIFVDQWREISSKYTDESLNLKEYLNKTEEEIQKTLPWFSLKSFNLPSSYLVLEEASEQECLRVLELYNSGKMKGK